MRSTDQTMVMRSIHVALYHTSASFNDRDKYFIGPTVSSHCSCRIMQLASTSQIFVSSVIIPLSRAVKESELRWVHFWACRALAVFLRWKARIWLVCSSVVACSAVLQITQSWRRSDGIRCMTREAALGSVREVGVFNSRIVMVVFDAIPSRQGHMTCPRYLME